MNSLLCLKAYTKKYIARKKKTNYIYMVNVTVKMKEPVGNVHYNILGETVLLRRNAYH